AVVLGEDGATLGRGITNSRSNYDLAAEVARTEAFVSARFHLLRREVERSSDGAAFGKLLRSFRLEQMLVQLASLRARIEREEAATVAPALKAPLARALETIFSSIVAHEEALLAAESPPARSDFFRDTAGAVYTQKAEEIGSPGGVSFDLLVGLYDKCIIAVENEPLELGFREHIGKALARIGRPGGVERAIDALAGITLATALVFVVQIATKFVHGAWIVVLIIPLIIWMLVAIHRHYVRFAEEIKYTGQAPLMFMHHTVVIPVSSITKATAGALVYATTISEDVRAVTVGVDPAGAEALRKQWEAWDIDVPLVVLDSPYRSVIRPIVDYVKGLEAHDEADLVTVIVPEIVPHHWWEHLLHNKTALYIRTALM
ncbi:MAG: hypothetical protein B7X11_05210, partial [Acidobacteria bacterium 37-65-4]